MSKRLLALALFIAVPTGASAGGLAGAPALPNVDVKSFKLEKAPANNVAASSKKFCAKDWENKRQGDCWVADSRKNEYYVHPRGYVVENDCLRDDRFTAQELVDALDGAVRKMDPKVPVSRGGCMGTFNPEWGAELVSAPWERNIRIRCPKPDKTSSTCASHHRVGRNEEISVITVGNIEGCMKEESSGLSGVMFHETLHAAGVDNFSTRRHNKAWELEQIEWIRDRVYAAEATCYFGIDALKKKKVNLLQCLGTVRHHSNNPRDHLCKGFDATFTDRRPSGFMRH